MLDAQNASSGFALRTYRDPEMKLGTFMNERIYDGLKACIIQSKKVFYFYKYSRLDRQKHRSLAFFPHMLGYVE